MYQRILVPFDGSATSTCGLDEAIKLAKLTGASLRLVHVVDDLSFATGFETYAVYAADVIPFIRRASVRILHDGKARAASAGVMAETELLDLGTLRLADYVVDQVNAWGADLIVIGTHGRRGMGRLMLGSDAEQIARIAPVPVLLVRAPEGAAGAPARTPASKAADVVENNQALAGAGGREP